MSLTLQPIGSIATPYASKYSAPRQPGLAKRRVTGIITLLPGHNFEQALSDLEGFDYVWVLFWFDRNTGWKPMVLPPVSDRKKRGLFATRSPFRPNPIGLSLCRLLRVQGRTLHVEDPDMLDGTPILDIKPYIPHTEARPGAREGWIEETHEGLSPAYSVTFSRAVRTALRSIPTRDRLEAVKYLRSILSRDPYPHVYRRIKRRPDGTLVIALRKWRFEYEIRGKRINVTTAGEAGR